MTLEAAQHIMKYAEEQACPVQMTFDPVYTDGWTADFKSDVHAQVCLEELRKNELSSRVSYTVYKHLSRLQ